MDFVLSDDEVQTLWLFLDVILSVKLGNKSFVVSTSMFNYLISEVKYMEKNINGKSEFYKLLVDIEETLGQIGFALAEENFKLKLKLAFSFNSNHKHKSDYFKFICSPKSTHKKYWTSAAITTAALSFLFYLFLFTS